MLQVSEVTMGARGFKSELGLGAFFSSALDSLGGFFCSGFPDADLVFAEAVADDVRAYAPVVMFEGGGEDGVVHVVVVGEGCCEPDRDLPEGKVGVLIVGGGKQEELVDRESLSFRPLGVWVSSLYEANVCGLNVIALSIWDVEPLSLPFVLLEACWADCGVLGEVTAAAASVAASSGGLVLFVSLQLFDFIFSLIGPILAVLGVVLGIVSAVQSLVQLLFEGTDGGGQVFGIVEEDGAVAGSCGFQNHCCRARGERGELCGDEFWDVVVISLVGKGDFNCLFEVGGGLSKGVGGIAEGLVDGGLGGCGDGSHIFNADESVGHFDERLVEEVEEEVVVVVAVKEGCHSVVRMLVLLCVLGLIRGCFL
jgi:hypothetical protein